MPKQYFEMFPKILYDMEGTSINHLLTTDIMRRVRVKIAELKDKVEYEQYAMRDGESIEQVAHKIYGDSRYHWVLLLLNNMIDPVHDVVLDNNSFEAHLYNKYGSIRNTTSTTLGVAGWDIDSESVVHHGKIIAGGGGNSPSRPDTLFYTPRFAGIVPAGSAAWSKNPYYVDTYGDVNPNGFTVNIYQKDSKTTTYWFEPEDGTLSEDNASPTIPSTINVGDIIILSFPYVWWSPEIDKEKQIERLAYGVPQKIIHKTNFSITTDLDSRTIPEIDLDSSWVNDGSTGAVNNDLVEIGENSFLPRVVHNSKLKLQAGQGGVTLFTNVDHFEKAFYDSDGTKTHSITVDVKSFEDPSVNPLYENVRAVSIFEKETLTNDAKRVIMILRQELLTDFINEFELLISR
jgi:hypothetical protein